MTLEQEQLDYLIHGYNLNGVEEFIAEIPPG